ncbi:MAG: hypothetical protein ACOX9R_11475 [Armatimonadota bacterium]|jgi:uncharacterized protein involved in exopolysaccharide biosynthesis
MRLIERYTWMHVLIVSVLGAGLIAAAAHFFLPGKFTATSSLLLNDRHDILATIAGDGGATPDQPSLERLQAILVSREIRGRIIDRLSLIERLRLDRGEALEALTEVSAIKNIGQDGISVAVTLGGYFAPNLPQPGYPLSIEQARELSAEIANLYIAELAEYLRETGASGTGETREFLLERRDQLQRELDGAQDRLESLRAQYELLDPESNAARLADRIRTLEQARADASAEADAARGSLGAAEGQLGVLEATRISSQVAVRNPLIASLQEELVNLQTDLATQLASGKTTEHRDVVQIRSAITNVQAQLCELEETVLSQIGEQPNPLHDEAVQQAVRLRVELAGANARRSQTESLLSEARGRMAEMPAVARDYVEIQRVAALTAERLTAIERALWLAEYDHARTEIGAPFTVLDHATPPTERDGPPTIVAGLIAFAALLVLQGILLIDRRWFGG